MKNLKLNGLVKKILIVIIILFFVLPFITKANPFFSVEYGTVGVVSRFGRIDRLARPGLNTKIPFAERVDYYSTQKMIYETSDVPQQSPYYNQTRKGSLLNSIEQKNYSDTADMAVDTSTKDGQQVSVRFTLRYSIDPEKILWIAQNVGTQEQLTERVVQATSRSISRNVAREFPANELYTGDVFNYQIRVAEMLQNTFNSNGIILDEFLVRQMKFSDEYVQALEQKQIELEKIKTEEFIAQQEEYKKQQKIVKAEGEAKAQEILKASIDSLLLEKMAIEKWNGILPTYMGSGSVPFVNIK